MFETLTKAYEFISKKVVEVETLMKGKDGEAKKKALIGYLADLIDIPGIPNFIEGPAKKYAIGLIVDKIVERMNVIEGWGASAEILTDKAHAAIAAAMPEPLSVTIDKVKALPSDADINAKFEALATKVKASDDDKWKPSIAFAMKWEGGKNYEGVASGVHRMLNTADKGGPTNRGITLPTLAVACATGACGNSNLDTLTQEEAEGIYKANYWDNYGWGDLPMPVCLCALDMSINHGGFAWIVQRALAEGMGQTLTIDGKYGPETKGVFLATAGAKSTDMASALCKQRKAYYDKIIAKDPTQNANKAGWYNRVKAMAQAANVSSPC